MHRRLGADARIGPLDVMVDEPQQLAVVIEVGSAEPAQWVDAPAAGVVPWTEDQVAARGGDGQKTFDCGMRIPAVEPAAVAVDGRSRRLHVTPIIVRLIRLMLPDSIGVPIGSSRASGWPR